MRRYLADVVIDAVDALSADIHRWADEKGFWDDRVSMSEASKKAVKIALLHSEVSELLEAVRKPGPSDHIPEHSNEIEEVADILIRLFDYAGGFHPDALGKALRDKMIFNESRPHKHGKRF